MSFRNVDREILRERYARVPCMRAYDALEPHLHPNLGLASARHLRTPVVTTDGEGFRRTPGPDGDLVDTATPRHLLAGVLVGASFTFGVGATGDGATIAAHLGELRRERWLNLGIRAANSTQELVSVLPFLADPVRIVVCSGANNLVAALRTDGSQDVYGPLFFQREVQLVGAVPVHDLVEALDGTRRVRRLRGVAAPPPSRARLIDRFEAALCRQLRDLTAMVRTCGGPARVLFCAQPFADVLDRGHVEQERGLLGLHDRRQGERWEAVRQFALARWGEYVHRLRAGCAALEVSFIELSAARFTGWSFVDRLHLTDHGYAQAAAWIDEALRREARP